MHRHSLKRHGYALGLLAFAVTVGGSPAFGAQANSGARATNPAPGDPSIVWAGNIAHPIQNPVFVYKNFSNVSSLTFNGNAQQGGRYLLVTPAAALQQGSVWYNNQVNVARGFLTSFTFAITPSSQSGTPGDGLAFLIQNSGLNALGADGMDIGYSGISNSLAIEFDTFLSAGYSDPNNNHVGIQSCGTGANTADHGTSCNLGLQPNLPVTLADGAKHAVSIRYFPGAPGTLTVTIDGQVVLSSAVDLGTLLSLNGNDAWVGFTGGTGADFETGTILNWVFYSAGSASNE